ncbi:MAG: aminotransferase class III-fold pyridoxal phosphate-dependent enzyme [Clostridia bacterium]
MKVSYTELKGKQEAGYGVTRWANAQEINKSLTELTDQPIYSVAEPVYKDIVANYFDVKCAKSKAITAEAKKYIPGGVQHNLAFNKPFPMCITKASGAYMYDLDGNKYFDFLQAGGPTILGSNNDVVREEAIKLIQECGPVTGLFHEAELLIAKEINKCMPNVEKFRMLGSGTEAVMGALRVARCATKKKRIIKVGGAYHGWSDQMVYGLKVPGTRQFLESFGIPNVIFSVIDEVRPNDVDMLEDYLKYNENMRGGTAAVIVEPVGPESGTRPVDFDYNTKVRALCDKYGALFIFDEVVTGFRVGIHGAQGLFNVVPDLTIFGKIVAGGYPAAGGIGGKAKYVDLCAAGVAGGAKKAYVGGTLAANPLSAMAGYVAIKEIQKQDACVKAGLAGNRLTDGLVDLIKKHELPYVAYNQGSIVHLECTGAMSYDFSSKNMLNLIKVLKKQDAIMVRKEAMEQMGAAYMANGIVTLAGSRLYTSMMDTDAIIDEALNCFDHVFGLVKKRDKVESLQIAEYKSKKALGYPAGAKREKKIKKAAKMMKAAQAEQAIADANKK